MKDLPWKAAVRLSSAVLKRGDQSRTHNYIFVLHIFLIFNIQSTVNDTFIVTLLYFLMDFAICDHNPNAKQTHQ